MDKPLILVVEPDPQHAAFIVQGLTDRKYDVCWVERAVDAIVCLIKRKPAVAVVDLRLADIPGSDLISLIHHLTPELPIIATVRDNSWKMEAEAREVGLFYYLIQPFTPYEFLRAITAAIEYTVRQQRGYDSITSLEPQDQGRCSNASSGGIYGCP